MTRTLNPARLAPLLEALAEANRQVMAAYPGESGERQPVHVVYGGAQLFARDLTPRLGRLALAAFDAYAPTPADLALAVRLADDPALAKRVHARVRAKLEREAVEDFRIDFEDGYGNRPDAEEDGHADSVAREVAEGMKAGTLPPFFGIRIKPFTEELKARSLRTLDLFLTRLVTETKGTLPPNFVVTFPKITHPAQVTALADALDLIEDGLGLPRGSVRVELMVETTQAISDATGVCGLPAQVAAARGRCVAAHFGTYDYTASCQVTAAHQVMTHASCDHARHVMQVALAGTGVWLSDGATNIMPVPPHRASRGDGSGPAVPLTPAQQAENRSAVHAAWRLHYDHCRHSLVNAFYQGWDLHPAQLPTRYAAVYAFFFEGLEAAATRLRTFVERAAQATLVGDVFDDAATGQGLLNFFLRAINCGAITDVEATTLTGVTLEEFQGRSFVRILANRRGGAPGG